MMTTLTFNTWQFDKLLGWSYTGNFFSGGQANVSVFLRGSTRFDYAAGCWTTNADGAMMGSNITVYAQYKFYTNGGDFYMRLGGDDAAGIAIYPADSAGNRNGDRFYYHGHGGGDWRGQVQKYFPAGWYRVECSNWNKSGESFWKNPGWYGLRILKWV